jgi:hypothetical protein
MLTSLICGIDLAENPSPFFLPAELASHTVSFSVFPTSLTPAAVAALFTSPEFTSAEF